MVIFSAHFVSSLIISASISLSFKPCINCSFSSLSISVQLHSTSAVLNLHNHCYALSLDCLIILQNYRDFIVSLYSGLNLLLSVSNKPFSLLHVSCSSSVKIAISCSLSLPSQFFMIDIFSVCLKL